MLAIPHMWLNGSKLDFIMNEVKISKPTAIDWASFCRDVLLCYFYDNKQKLGGEGVTVEIDENKFGKRKYHRGHAVDGQSILVDMNGGQDVFSWFQLKKGVFE